VKISRRQKGHASGTRQTSSVAREHGNHFFDGFRESGNFFIERRNIDFEFKGFIYLRDDPDRIASRLEQPDAVGISCYIWNWGFSRALARAVRARHPDCLIVMGGPQVPSRSDGFFVDHPSVDVLVHNEGELAFADILLERLRERPDLTRVAGCSVRVDGDRSCRTTPRAGRSPARPRRPRSTNWRASRPCSGS